MARNYPESVLKVKLMDIPGMLGMGLENYQTLKRIIQTRSSQLEQTRKAMKLLAEYSKRIWIEKGKALGIRNPTYYKGLTIAITDGGFGFTITSTSLKDNWIDHGKPAMRLPDAIKNWKVAKQQRDKKGRFKKHKNKHNPSGRYIIIPFSHFAPFGHSDPSSLNLSHVKQQLPPSIHRYATETLTDYKKELTDQGVQENYKRTSFYSHGKAHDTVSKKHGWKRSKYAGIRKASYQRRGGGYGGAEFISFRTITPNSPGWVIAEFKAKHLPQRVHDSNEFRKAAEIVVDAVRHDLGIRRW